MAKVKKEKADGVHLVISPPNMETGRFLIRGTVPLVMNRFSQKAKLEMMETQKAGSTAKKGKKRTPKDFKAMYEAAKHISTQGWYGIPASAFRIAMVSACRLAGYKMSRAKLSVFIEADGFDRDDDSPLVKITKGKPKQLDAPVRIGRGSADIHSRPMWSAGWEVFIRIRYDADQFTLKDVSNLLVRVGIQVGILEGRPDSKSSCGLGWGLFDVCGTK